MMSELKKEENTIKNIMKKTKTIHVNILKII
jgi:hypothetical protein